MQTAYAPRVRRPHGYPSNRRFDLARSAPIAAECRKLRDARQIARQLGDPEAAYTAVQSDRVTVARIARVTAERKAREPRRVITPQVALAARIARQSSRSFEVAQIARQNEALRRAFAGELARFEGKA